jgi:hypothetical protein
MFKKTFASNTKIPVLTCKVKSNIKTLLRTVHLQIYNYTTNLYETIATNTGYDNADTEFTLSGAPTGAPANYYDANKVVTAVVWQEISA